MALVVKRGDVAFTCFGLRVTVRYSKTIQFSHKVLRQYLVPVPGSRLCQVQAFELMCLRLPLVSSAPAFSLSINGRVKPLTYAVFQAFLRSLLSKAGYPAHLYTSHSLRRGGASWAFKQGVPEVCIQACTRRLGIRRL